MDKTNHFSQVPTEVPPKGGRSPLGIHHWIHHVAFLGVMNQHGGSLVNFQENPHCSQFQNVDLVCLKHYTSKRGRESAGYRFGLMWPGLCPAPQCSYFGYCPVEQHTQPDHLRIPSKQSSQFFQNSQGKKFLLWKVKSKKKRLFYHPSPIRTYFPN